MANAVVRPFSSNPFTNPSGLPAWLRRISQAGYEITRSRAEARKQLAPVLRRTTPTLTGQEQAVLRNHLSLLLRQEITLSADGVRRLQATLRAARAAVQRAGLSGNRQILLKLQLWDAFLERSLSGR